MPADCLGLFRVFRTALLDLTKTGEDTIMINN